jgi:hypothetical protein
MLVKSNGFFATKALLLLVVLLLFSGFGLFAGVRVAKADTGGYPDVGKACIWSPYNVTGYCKHTLANGTQETTYEWGSTHDNESSIYSGRGYAYCFCSHKVDPLYA